jgi:hypothetical protein
MATIDVTLIPTFDSDANAPAPSVNRMLAESLSETLRRVVVLDLHRRPKPDSGSRTHRFAGLPYTSRLCFRCVLDRTVRGG